MNTTCNTHTPGFGAWLSNELAQRGMSRRDLARRGNISESYLSCIVSGKRRAGTKRLTSIARALDLSVDLVFEKAGLLPPSGLSPAMRALIDLIKQLPDSDVEALIALVKPAGV